METFKNCTVIILTEEDKRKQENEEWQRRSELYEWHAIEYAQKENWKKMHEDLGF
jgi:hypothetical protein